MPASTLRSIAGASSTRLSASAFVLIRLSLTAPAKPMRSWMRPCAPASIPSTSIRSMKSSWSKQRCGGGIPVNYLRDRSQADDLPAHERDMLGADLEPSAVLTEALRVAREAARDAAAEHLLEGVTILLEPGRSVIADAGVVLTSVQNIKRRPETNDVWLLTDAGYNLLLSMNNYKWYYHLISASRACDPLEAQYKVAGPLCDSGDVYFDIERHGRLPDYRLLPRDVKPGEVLALLNSGAYSLAQMFPYNGRPLPAAVMVRESGKADLIRKRDSYDDLLMNDVW